MKRTPIRKSRSKARPGRMKGEAMTRLRLAAYVRDNGLCSECGKLLGWDNCHLAHIKSKRRHGDSLENVRILCIPCHLREHSPKACPPKQGGM